MALAVCGLQFELREVELKNKPEEMLKISPKATVPVLQLENGDVLEESLDIMYWALQINDPHNWLADINPDLTNKLIRTNDNDFKQHLDRYKYADRFPEYSVDHYRQQASQFPMELDQLLSQNGYLVSDKPTLVDIALFPFIRQFAFVDKSWFDAMSWNYLKQWLESFLSSALFQLVMQKHSPWKSGGARVIFPDE